MSNEIPASTCAECGYLIDRSTPVRDDGSLAGPGALSICIGCGHIATFAADLSLVELTMAQRFELATNPDFQRQYLALQVALQSSWAKFPESDRRRVRPAE